MSLDYLVAVCRTCVYSDDGFSPADKADGEWILCVRHPPTVFRATEDGYTGGDGVFPRVDRYACCGEWILDLSSDEARKANLSHAITLREYNQLLYSITPRVEKD